MAVVRAYQVLSCRAVCRLPRVLAPGKRKTHKQKNGPVDGGLAAGRLAPGICLPTA